jgi:hypothetical protein
VPCRRVNGWNANDERGEWAVRGGCCGSGDVGSRVSYVSYRCVALRLLQAEDRKRAEAEESEERDFQNLLQHYKKLFSEENAPNIKINVSGLSAAINAGGAAGGGAAGDKAAGDKPASPPSSSRPSARIKF